jgi:hypothetical protein
MTDRDRDAKLSARYRELGSEEPPPALDAAILAAAHRAVASRPRSASRRWMLPVSLAAVLVLSVSITLQVQRERPMGEEYAGPSGEAPAKRVQETPGSTPKESAMPPAADQGSTAPASAPARARAPEVAAPVEKRAIAVPVETPAIAVPAAPPAPAQNLSPRAVPEAFPGRMEAGKFAEPPRAASEAVAPAPASSVTPPVPAMQAAPAAAGAVAPPLMKREEAVPERRAKEMSRDAMSPAPAAAIAETPERWLERIAQLRAKGLHEEADRSLADFRRANPAYRISEEWLRKVEQR